MADMRTGARDQQTVQYSTVQYSTVQEEMPDTVDRGQGSAETRHMPR